MEAIDKLRNIIQWANYQNEGFNERFKTISDIEKVYDYCQAHNEVEFLDWESLSSLDEDAHIRVTKEVTLLLGYSVF